jgi:hypothetical protein
VAGVAGRGHAVVLSQYPGGRIQIHLRNECAVGDAMLALVVNFRLWVARAQMAVAAALRLASDGQREGVAAVADGARAL